MQLTIITSTPQNVSLGSGTYVAAASLRKGIERLGHRARMVCPRSAPGALGHTLQRFAFNLSLSPERVGGGGSAVVGLDMDGFTLSGHIHPFACYVHGTLADEATFERGWTAQLLKLQARAERRSARHADLVLTTSEYSANRIAHFYGVARDRISVVPPAFDVINWQSEFTSAVRNDAGVSHPTVLCVARMYRRKNIRSLIGAARLVVDTGQRLAVRIVGDGPERRELERVTHALELTDVVTFTGQVPHRRLVAEFATCDVFCLPSLQEGFGIVYLEAMASGKPVVALHASSTPELIEHGVNGLLAEPHDEADLAGKLRTLLDDAALQTAMGTVNSEKARAFDVLRTTKRLLDLVAAVT